LEDAQAFLIKNSTNINVKTTKTFTKYFKNILKIGKIFDSKDKTNFTNINNFDDSNLIQILETKNKHNLLKHKYEYFVVSQGIEVDPYILSKDKELKKFKIEKFSKKNHAIDYIHTLR